MNKLEEAYKEYLKMPKAKSSGFNRDSEIYSNNWCVLTGLAFMHPHTHRHFTFEEFIENCNNNETLYNRFIK